MVLLALEAIDPYDIREVLLRKQAQGSDQIARLESPSRVCLGDPSAGRFVPLGTSEGGLEDDILPDIVSPGAMLKIAKHLRLVDVVGIPGV